MKTSKVMIVLMAVSLVVAALSFFAFPGMGMLMILYIVSVSDGVKEKLVELGVDEGNIVVVR